MYYLAALAASALFQTCSESPEETAAGFSNPVALTADSITIDQIIDPFQWTVAGNHCVILGKSTEKALHVYSLPDFRYCYSALTRGKGPGELGPYVFIIPGDVSSDKLLLHERLTTNALSEFSVSDTALSLGRKPSVHKGSMMGIAGDTLAVKERVKYEEEKCYTVLESTEHPGAELDSMLNYTIYKMTHLSSNTVRIFKINVPTYLYNGGTLVMVYDASRRLDFFDISGGRFNLIKTIGDTSTLEELGTRVTETEDGKRGFDFQGEHFPAATATGRYIYVLSCSYSPDAPDDMSKKSSSVLVYDWQGNEVRKFTLDRYATRIVVDSTSGALFCYDDNLDFEQVYVYRPKL